MLFKSFPAGRARYARSGRFTPSYRFAWPSRWSGYRVAGGFSEYLNRLLRADEAGVERAGNGDVGGSLYDGAPVGEDGERVRAAAEAQQEVVGAQVGDLGVVCQSLAQSVEVHRAMMLMDLH